MLNLEDNANSKFPMFEPGEIAQQSRSQAGWSEFEPQDPHGG